ncbi:MAG: hypothetical protein COC24_005280 [Alphaproteobacteria bacterium]|nr:hypothetical protein [Alphaproteobacteria bacterium]
MPILNIKLKLLSIITIALTSLFGNYTAYANQNNIKYDPVIYNEKAIPVTGKRLTKSGSARLATITKEKISLSHRSVYLPAGQIITLTKLCEPDRNNVIWCFAVTQNGLGIYVHVHTNIHSKKNDHYFKFNSQKGLFAIVQQAGKLTTKSGAIILDYTTSEIYKVVGERGVNDFTMIVDPSTKKTNFTEPTEVHVDSSHESHFTVINGADIMKPEAFNLIRPVFDGELVDDLISAVSNWNISEITIENLKKQLANNNLVETKKCNQTIDIKKTIDGNGGIDSSKFFAIFKLKLGVTASYSNDTHYPAKLKFTAHRYTQKAPSGKILRFFEAWENKYYNENCIDINSSEIIARDDDIHGKGDGRLTLKSATSIGLWVSETDKHPVYSCKKEYFILLDHLTQGDGSLSFAAAELIIANLARFQGAGDAINCIKRPKKKSDV